MHLVWIERRYQARRVTALRIRVELVRSVRCDSLRPRPVYENPAMHTDGHMAHTDLVTKSAGSIESQHLGTQESCASALGTWQLLTVRIALRCLIRIQPNRSTGELPPAVI